MKHLIDRILFNGKSVTQGTALSSKEGVTITVTIDSPTFADCAIAIYQSGQPEPVTTGVHASTNIHQKTYRLPIPAFNLVRDFETGLIANRYVIVVAPQDDPDHIWCFLLEVEANDISLEACNLIYNWKSLIGNPLLPPDQDAFTQLYLEITNFIAAHPGVIPQAVVDTMLRRLLDNLENPSSFT